ncbi:ornithine carbamoyltransferase [Sulfitobacter sp. F26169L]|uniref:ornithine carbamoyltransferase n=1 Tax=Sulfitobacter sp. F26169L TaxID=2996015 RepID=UPI002260CCFA|nr:ornithine carbamoyltransferase [Sulfitobacter sp. F26169L]MCX7568233.1 ornithine carbamoyltransferase [Sulfitobacter sp. F26169L]
MAFNLRNRSFLTLGDFTEQELVFLLKLAGTLKAAKYAGTEVAMLKGREIALVFDADSKRAGFDVAAHDQGATVAWMGQTGLQMGRTEAVKDTARVLGRLYDAIEVRGFAHDVVRTLADWSGVPVYNGLSDAFNPAQVLADFLTMKEHSQKLLSEISYCFIGDASRYMGDSLLIGGAKMGMDVRFCAPQKFQPSIKNRDEAHAIAQQTGAQITITDEIYKAVEGVDFVYTDVWIREGQSQGTWASRIEALGPYQVNGDVMDKTGNPRAKFMHCLPAFHNSDTTMGKEIQRQFGINCMEVTDEVFESPASIVFDQAENRMHIIKAILVATLGS